MNYEQEYKEKQLSADQATGLVKDGDWVDFGLGTNIPDLFDEALARRTGEFSDVKVRGSLSAKPIKLVEADRFRASYTYNSWHCGSYERKYCDWGLCFYIPMTFRAQSTFYKRYLDVDVACMSVTPMDKHGWFNLSLANTAAKTILNKAKIVILEVNENLPVALGGFDECIHISRVDAVIEGEHGPLPELIAPTATEADKKIAGCIAERIRSGSVLQLGIGGIPNCVGRMLAQSDVRDLGMHTEMLCNAYLDLFLAGKLTNRLKEFDRDKGVWSLCLGSQALYDWVDQNPGLASCPVEYVNEPEAMARHRRLVAVNSCVEVDLFGQICAESAGTRHVSGTGGQLDFLTGSFMSEEGQGFICLPSTYFDRKEGILKSRIVPTLPSGGIVTDPRSQSFQLVTEYGIVNLAGRSTWERAERIISVAHPDFQDQLILQAEKMGIWRKTNKRFP